MTVVFIVLIVAVGALMLYEIYSLIRSIVKRRKELKSKQSNKTITKGEK